MTNFNPLATAAIGHNQPPATPFDLIKQEIEDLFDEARHFCDGEAIADEATAAAITELHDRIHAAGSKADKLRVEEKAPLDEAVKAVQAKYAPLISDTKSAKGKVVLGKEACQTLLTPWRTAKALAAQKEAARIAEEAAEARRKADAAIQSSSGNLAAREEAEAVLADAKRLERGAKKADKAATTGTGLRTVYDVVLVDEESAMDWLWGRAKQEVLAVAQRNAEELVRSGARNVPGFRVDERKVAR
jgi:hypothetical protein